MPKDESLMKNGYHTGDKRNKGVKEIKSSAGRLDRGRFLYKNT
ncbi:hypothetical protein [Maribacter stanieri]|tara:strand:- start:552 stop:680 length:129 start_codon:yes stop_codon:yes gene_type:complete